MAEKTPTVDGQIAAIERQLAESVKTYKQPPAPKQATEIEGGAIKLKDGGR